MNADMLAFHVFVIFILLQPSGRAPHGPSGPGRPYSAFLARPLSLALPL